MGNCLSTSADDGQDAPIINNDHSQLAQSPQSIEPPPPYQAQLPMFHPSPNETRLASELTEEDQIKIIKRIGLIQQLPSMCYNEEQQKLTECPICIIDFEGEDRVRRLPCLHLFHQSCIDDWLMRSPTCPSCMTSVESAMLSSFDDF